MMKYLEKLATKKKIVLISTIYSGFVTLCILIGNIKTSGSTSNFNLSDTSSLVSLIGSVVTVIQIIFYLYLVLAIIITVLSGYYFFKKNKKEYVILTEFILNAINTLLLLLSLEGFNAAIKVIKMAINGNYSGLFSAYSSLGAMQSAGQYIQYFGYISILVFIINVFAILMAKKVIKVNFVDFDFNETKLIETTDEPTISVDSEKAKELAQAGANQAKAGLEKVKEFLKTKNGKIVLGIVVAVVVLFGGYKVYDNYFNKTAINIMPKVSLEYGGEDGTGYISDVNPGTIDYDRNDYNVRSFVNSITYDYDTSHKLKNGDKVKVHAVYDKEKAKDLKLDVKNDTVTVKVKGLTENYAKAKDVPEKILKQAKKDIEAEMKDSYENDSYSQYQYSLESVYFAGSKLRSDHIIGIYKVDETSTFLDETETETYYVACYVSGVNSDYLKDDDPFVFADTLYDDSFEKITDPAKVEDALKNKFKNYDLTKFN